MMTWRSMFLITIDMRTLLMLTIIFITSTIAVHIWLFNSMLSMSLTFHRGSSSMDNFDNYTTVRFSRKSPIVMPCGRSYKVAFTFDDGPHPVYTTLVTRTLNRQKIKAGFFLLGTSIQSFLGTHRNLSVHQFERPRIGFLLLQDYSLVEKLLDGHEIYLHGWLHEKINEMRLQTVVDNIATQYLEIGLLKGFKPVYRAPWGIGTSPGHVKKNILLTQILDQIGIHSAYWNIDTKDYLTNVNEDRLITNAVQAICKKRGGLILMHDNRPSTSALLDRLINSIKASGHAIVSPSEINPTWNDPVRLNRTKRYVQLLRERARKVQSSFLLNTNVGQSFRPVEITLPKNPRQTSLLSAADPVAAYKGLLKVTPSLKDI